MANGGIELEKTFPIGTKVIIVGVHPHTGSTGIVVDYQMAGLINRRGAMIRLNNGLNCFVFNSTNMRKI